MKALLTIFSLLLALGGCSDGVPEVADPHHPRDTDGTEMTQMNWIKKFCIDKPDNEKCLRVANAKSMDSGKRGLPKGW